MAVTPFNMRSSMANRFGIDIKIEPSPVLLAAQMMATASDLEDFREPLERCVKNVMMPSIRKNFDVQGRPSWAPLSQATLNRRKSSSSGTSNRILSRTAALRRRAASLKIWTIRKDAAFIEDLGDGNGGVPWAKLHQEGYEGSGSSIGRLVRNGVPQVPSARMREGDEVVEGYVGDIPARPFLVVQPEDEEKMEEEFDKWVGETFAHNGWVSR